MRTNNIFISIGLSLLLLGCNSNSSKSVNTGGTEKISVPTNIDMKLPNALEKSKTSQKVLQKADATLNSTSSGYLELRNNIADAKIEQKDVQVNLLLAEKLMPQIQEACADIPLGEKCEIAKGVLSFVLDSEMRTDIGNIVGETFPTDTPDKTMTLGKTTFTIEDDAKDYQYVLTMDMSQMIGRDDDDQTIYVQTLKWSKDENRVLSIYTQTTEGTNSTLSIRYNKDANGQTQMEIDDSFNASEANSQTLERTAPPTSTPDGNKTVINVDNDTPPNPPPEILYEEFHLKITNKDDYFKIVSNSKFPEDIESFSETKKVNTSSSIGELSDKGGYLNFRGLIGNDEYRETEKFDANGEVIFSGYCDSSLECDLNDESTWSEYGDTVSVSAMEVNFVELSVSGGNLNEGGYLLLAPNTDIATLSTEKVFDNVVGDVYVSEEFNFASLYNAEYLSQVNTLPLVHMIFDEKNPEKEPTVELVSAENRPTLTQK